MEQVFRFPPTGKVADRDEHGGCRINMTPEMLGDGASRPLFPFIA